MTRTTTLVGGSGGTIDGTDAIYSVKPGSAPILFADLWQYEVDHNTGGDKTPEGQPDIDSNPYDLISDGAGGLFVSDAGANAVFHVDGKGEIMPSRSFRIARTRSLEPWAAQCSTRCQLVWPRDRTALYTSRR